MSNLHAPGLAPIPTQWVNPEHLQPEQRVRYNARIWVVHEVLPVAGLDGQAVVATTEYPPHERSVLLYSRISSAELVVQSS